MVILWGHSVGHCVFAQLGKNGGTPVGSNLNQSVESMPRIDLLCQWLEGQNLSQPTVDAMKTMLRQHASETRWVGQSDKLLFSIVAERVESESPRKQQILLARASRSHSLAIQEILTAKSLLDLYGQVGLTDATALRQAILDGQSGFSVQGNAKILAGSSQVVESYVFAFVVAEESQLISYLKEPPRLEAVRASYRKVLHRRARELMKAQDWQNALVLWHHLHERQLVSPELYLDAARCFRGMGKDADCVKILEEAFAVFASEQSPEFFEQIGELSILVPSAAAQQQAVRAFRRASELLY
jgi:hypothetical protein